MEMGSSSAGGSDSLNDGLKFGKKIYFEDAGGGGGGSGGGSSSKGGPAAAPAPAPPGRKGKGVVQGGGGQQPPRCQVEGCKVDLTGAKAYYCRHKVCGMHSKAPKVVVNGLEQRFCQQCSRFHHLHEFDQGKRSCRRRLAGHNERRRKPPPGPLSPRYGRFSSSFHDDGGRFRSFLMDFSYPGPRPPPPPTGRDVWPTVKTSERMAAIHHWQGGLEGAPPVAAAHHGTHPYIQGPSPAIYPGSELPPGECLAGVADSSCALSLLSTQQWGTAALRNQAATISVSSSFDTGPMTPRVAANSYAANPWGVKGHGAGSSSHDMHHHIGLGHVADAGHGQFSGELELALQGNRQCLDPGPGRGYDHSGNVTHWSL